MCFIQCLPSLVPLVYKGNCPLVYFQKNVNHFPIIAAWEAATFWTGSGTPSRWRWPPTGPPSRSPSTAPPHPPRPPPPTSSATWDVQYNYDTENFRGFIHGDRGMTLVLLTLVCFVLLSAQFCLGIPFLDFYLLPPSVQTTDVLNDSLVGSQTTMVTL